MENFVLMKGEGVGLIKRLEREIEKIMERMRRFSCSELESKVQRWEKCVISLPTAWFWNR